MLVEESKLHWMGIDLRSRSRRRVAVVATYAAFLFAVWVHPRRTHEVVWLLWGYMLVSPSWNLVKESFPKWGQSCLVGIALAVTALALFKPRQHIDPWGLDGAMFAVAILALASVLGATRLVGSANSDWIANATRKGSRLSWRGQQRLAQKGFLFGLDGFAYNEYGLRFRDLSEDQQAVVIGMRQANPQGRWMLGMERKIVDDERLRAEDNEVRAQVQRMMTFVLWCSAIWWNWRIVSMRDTPASSSNTHVVQLGWSPYPRFGDDIIAWAWTVYALAFTLRQAIILWTEEDPRAVSEELQVMQEQEA